MTELPDSVFISLALAAFAIAIGALACERAIGQEIHHHQGMSADVDRFYSTWRRPDDLAMSCCGGLDCYPVEAKFAGGNWYAVQRETGNWIKIPKEKVEHNRDGPDARAHICASSGNEAVVYCFIASSGM